MDVLKQFGAIGFLCYITYFIFPLYLLWKGLKASAHVGPLLEERIPTTFLVLRLAFVMGFTAMLMNIGESTFYNQLLQAFLWLWLGLGARCAKLISGLANEYPSPLILPDFHHTKRIAAWPRAT